MGLKKVEEKLLKYTDENNTGEIIKYINNYMKAIEYSKRDLSSLEIIIVIKNTGGSKVFSLIKGYIVEDKLDISYTESRELVCIGKWNVKKAMKVRFENGEVISTILNYKDLHKKLFDTVEPTSIRYTIGVEEGSIPKQVLVDCSMLKGLDYKDLKDCVNDAYNRVLKLEGEQQNNATDLTYYIVDFM